MTPKDNMPNVVVHEYTPLLDSSGESLTQPSGDCRTEA